MNQGSDSILIGETEIEAGDLARRPRKSLVLFDSNSCVVMGNDLQPCEVEMAIDTSQVPAGWPAMEKPMVSDTATRVMIITRGTRGDVQPFIALARGLASILGWHVTICTELNCKSFVKSHAAVENGVVKFRPSGGNTPAHITTAMARWAINSKSEFMQAMMLARSEIEFFDSAPIMVHWARKLQPHLLVYGFTLPSIAIIISELLHIPIIGFILQPSVIPSSDTVAVEAINTHFLCCVDKVEETMTGHSVQAWLKWSQENAPALGQVNRVRAQYDLLPMRANSYDALQKQDMPIIVPINPYCFGKRPADWAAHTVFTDFIFLRQETDSMKLNDVFTDFINEAKAAQCPIVLMAFSSMPVPRSAILEMAIKLIEDCVQRPRVIALVGGQANDPLRPDLEAQVKELRESKFLLEAAGAPFGALFPHMSCLIIHGGLGTTAEAIRSGHPIIVTGVLLMDQRFWGKRVAQLRMGPEPVHIDDFRAVCVQQVEQCLAQACVEHCKAVAQAAAGRTEDGVEESVMMVKQLFEECPFPWITAPEDPRCCKCLCADCGCCIS
eukprot:EG_transcript_5587